MQLPVWGGRTLESSDVLVVGTIHGFSLEAIAKRNESSWRFFFVGQRDRNRLLLWLSDNQKPAIKHTYESDQEPSYIKKKSICTHPKSIWLMSRETRVWHQTLDVFEDRKLTE